nr:ORF69 [Human gammaherpesvirus 8]
MPKSVSSHISLATSTGRSGPRDIRRCLSSRLRSVPPGARSASVSSKHRNGLRKFISDKVFFSIISHRHELGVDFLREMETPICTSKTVMLPLDLSTVAPGRCVSLSPFGHSSNMGFQCALCPSTENPTVAQGSRPQTMVGDALKKNNELCSVALAFYHHADKVIQHKTFYLSLLSHSMDVVRQSFLQPGLLYANLVLKTFGHDPLPIFTTNNGMLTMCILFKTRALHLGETALRLLMDNLPNYKISADCCRQSYVVKFVPTHPDTASIAVQVHTICEAVAALDCTDEMRDDIQKGTALVNAL